VPRLSGVDRTRLIRNVAIVVVIAALVRFIPGGGRAASAFEAALWAAFAIGFGYLGLRMYREHRISLHSLGDSHRWLLYSVPAVGLLLWAGRARMWQTGGGELVWFVLLGFAVYALLEVYRHSRSY
jgi:hypothetical protein